MNSSPFILKDLATPATFAQLVHLNVAEEAISVNPRESWPPQTEAGADAGQLTAILYEAQMLQQKVFLARADVPDCFAIGEFIDQEESACDEIAHSNSSPEECLEQLLDNFVISHTWFGNAQRAIWVRKRIGSLTSGEREVLLLSLQGLQNKMIATRLDVSERTVENRRRSILNEFGERSLFSVARVIYETVGFAEVEVGLSA